MSEEPGKPALNRQYTSRKRIHQSLGILAAMSGLA